MLTCTRAGPRVTSSNAHAASDRRDDDLLTADRGPRAAAAALDLRLQAFIDGRFVDAQSGATFPCISPLSGESLGDVASCDTPDVDLAVAAARRSFEQGVWSELG